MKALSLAFSILCASIAAHAADTTPAPSGSPPRAAASGSSSAGVQTAKSPTAYLWGTRKERMNVIGNPNAYNTIRRLLGKFSTAEECQSELEKRKAAEAKSSTELSCESRGM